MTGISAFMKETSGSFLVLPPVKTQLEDSIYKPESRHHGTLILDFPATIDVRNKFMLLSCLVYVQYDGPVA
jgi:hypothetical protein